MSKPVTDCGQVCRYLDFLEWCEQVAPRDVPTTIERNAEIEAHLDATSPGWRSR